MHQLPWDRRRWPVPLLPTPLSAHIFLSRSDYDYQPGPGLPRGSNGVSFEERSPLRPGRSEADMSTGGPLEEASMDFESRFRGRWSTMLRQLFSKRNTVESAGSNHKYTASGAGPEGGRCWCRCAGAQSLGPGLDALRGATAVRRAARAGSTRGAAHPTPRTRTHMSLPVDPPPQSGRG